jgi:hypothetical protein
MVTVVYISEQRTAIDYTYRLPNKGQAKSLKKITLSK